MAISLAMKQHEAHLAHNHCRNALHGQSLAELHRETLIKEQAKIPEIRDYSFVRYALVELGGLLDRSEMLDSDSGCRSSTDSNYYYRQASY